MKEERKIAEFLNHLQMLKNNQRSGWVTVLAPNESIAEHSYRTTVIGLIIAKMLNLKKDQQLQVLIGCLFHDVEECYIGDLHKIAQNYLIKNDKKIKAKILEHLPKKLILDYKKVLNTKNREIIEIIEDADKLECALTAKYYLDLGYKTKDWITNCGKKLNTKIAKKIFNEIKKMDTIKWINENKTD